MESRAHERRQSDQKTAQQLKHPSFYVDADCNHGSSLVQSLYRAAEHTKDYLGEPTRFAGYNKLPRAVVDRLKD